MIIYKATNIKNNKSYVGQTMISLDIRKSQHNHVAMKTEAKTAIHRAIRKYGMKNFNWESICECNTVDELNNMEKYYIKEYDTFSKNGYNMTSGGENYVVSDEARKNMSEAKTGKNHPNYGKSLSKETRKKMSESAKGKVKSKEHREKLSIAQTGRKYSDEHKRKLSEMRMGENNARGMLGKTHSEETRKKMSDAHSGEKNHNYGKHPSENSRLKMSIAHIGKKQPIVQCPYCKRSGGSASMKPHHFDNCRSK